MKAVTGGGGGGWSRIVSESLPLLPFNMLLVLQSATPPHHDGLKPWKPLARYWATGLWAAKNSHCRRTGKSHKRTCLLSHKKLIRILICNGSLGFPVNQGVVLRMNGACTRL